MPLRQLINVAYFALTDGLEQKDVASLDARLLATPEGVPQKHKPKSRGVEALMQIMQQDASRQGR